MKPWPSRVHREVAGGAIEVALDVVGGPMFMPLINALTFPMREPTARVRQGARAVHGEKARRQDRRDHGVTFKDGIKGIQNAG